MFTVVNWRHGMRSLEKCESLEEAKDFVDGMGDFCFSECILDENNIIVDDQFRYVMTRNENRVGQEYYFK